MFDIGWSELLLIAVVTVIVVGPKDLPRALRTVGQWAAKVRAVAREFQGSIDEMIRESELDELRRETQSIVNLDLDETPRRIDAPRGGEGFDPPSEGDPESEADAEAEADTAYTTAGAIAPAHSLPVLDRAPAEQRPAEVPPEGAGEEQEAQRTPTRANG